MIDIICFSHLRWDFVWQRPQHLLSRLGTDYRVLFVEEPIASAQATEPHLEVKPYNASVTVLRLIFPMSAERWIGHGDPLTQHTYEQLLTEYMAARHIEHPLVWLYTPMACDFVHAIPMSLLIVDVMDQLSAFKGAPTELIKREADALRSADIVFTGGVGLFRDKLPYNPHTYLFPSGVDIEHFEAASTPSQLTLPPDIATLQGTVLGYYGVIDERMDLELIARLATNHPEWQIVMVGPVVKIDPAGLPRAANIHWIGMRSYDELPAYLARFNVALIPFALNESTRFVSPTKTLEYMAAHKPIVSTPIRDVMELYGAVVRIGYDQASFEQHIQRALSQPADGRLAAENELLNAATWDSIVARMKRIITNRLPLSLREVRAKTPASIIRLPLETIDQTALGGDR